MLVSVIMPVKDAEQTVLSAISSILEQTLSDLELIIIDDHSGNNTVKLVKSIADTRIKLVTNKRQGLAHALNTGIEIAQGKFIARMDADDIAYPTRLEKQWHFARQNPSIDVISCLVVHKNIGDNIQEGYMHHANWLNSIRSPLDHYNQRYADATVAHPTVFFRADLMKRFGHYSCQELPEDFELWLRWMEQGVKFAKVPEVLLTWTDYPTRLSRSHENYKTDKFFEVKARYFSKWYNRNYTKKEIWVWGYGKQVFKKSKFFTNAGIRIEGYIDFAERPKAPRKVRSIKMLQPKVHELFLILVGDRDGKKNIADFFSTRDLELGKDYFFMT